MGDWCLPNLGGTRSPTGGGEEGPAAIDSQPGGVGGGPPAADRQASRGTGSTLPVLQLAVPGGAWPISVSMCHQ